MKHPSLLKKVSYNTWINISCNLPIPYCLTYKSSHSCWYHASAPHPYIRLFTTILFHPSLSLPTTYLLPDLVAAYLTILSTPFASIIISTILLKPLFKPALTVTLRYLYFSTSSILLPQKVYIISFFTPFIQITFKFFH